MPVIDALPRNYPPDLPIRRCEVRHRHWPHALDWSARRYWCCGTGSIRWCISQNAGREMGRLGFKSLELERVAY